MKFDRMFFLQQY